MTVKRPTLALAAVPLVLAALLAACDEAPSDEGRGASGEVLEGTVSDAMLPVDRVRSEPPLEDPEAFAEAQEKAAEAAAEVEAADDGDDAQEPDAEGAETSETAAAPDAEPAD